MGRILDHATREIAIGEAAWRVLVRDGPARLSVRNVALEAGLAPSSLRYVFPSQDALRAHALDLVRRRVQHRIAALPEPTSVRNGVELRMQHLLPLDAERRLEMEVFMVIGSMSLSDPAIRPSYDRAAEELDAGVRGLLERLATEPRYAGMDVASETIRTSAVLDGLALHLIRRPADEPTDWARSALARHLDSLG